MYWQKRFDRPSKDSVLEGKILAIRAKNKDFGYRRIYGELHTQGVAVNKKRVQHIVQKLNLQVTSFTRKSRKYSSTREQWEQWHPTACIVALKQVSHTRRLQPILQSSSIMKKIIKEIWLSKRHISIRILICSTEKFSHTASPNGLLEPASRGH